MTTNIIPQTKLGTVLKIWISAAQFFFFLSHVTNSLCVFQGRISRVNQSLGGKRGRERNPRLWFASTRWEACLHFPSQSVRHHVLPAASRSCPASGGLTPSARRAGFPGRELAPRADGEGRAGDLPPTPPAEGASSLALFIAPLPAAAGNSPATLSLSSWESLPQTEGFS